MASFSKNYEATGQHDRSYDIWRRRLSTLPEGTFTPLTFLEYSRIPYARVGVDWPLFRINCVVLPEILPQGIDVDENHLNKAVINSAPQLSHYRVIAQQLNTPVFVVVSDQSFSRFLVQEIDGADSSIKELSEKEFAALIGQEWQSKRNEQTGTAISGRVLSYSSWHRRALTYRSYLTDIDYVEIRNGKPSIVLEATKATSADLRRAVFDFLTRGFPQMAVITQLAETLQIPGFVMAYPNSLSDILLFKLTRDTVITSDPLNSQRYQISKSYEQRGIPRRTAQSRACEELFQKHQSLFHKLFDDSSNVQEFKLPDYQVWLEQI